MWLEPFTQNLLKKYTLVLSLYNAASVFTPNNMSQSGPIFSLLFYLNLLFISIDVKSLCTFSTNFYLIFSSVFIADIWLLGLFFIQ